MLNLLTVNDILFALCFAAFITWAITIMADFIAEKKAPDLETVIKKCYDMFPMDILQFHGEIYKRGMNIRLVTRGNKIFEGKFLGLNSDNMICLMTKGFIIAQSLKNVEEMEVLEQED